MKLKTISGNGREVKPSFNLTSKPVVFYKRSGKQYQFCVEVYNSATGDKTKLFGSQLEWQEIIDKLQSDMAGCKG